jgi:hypothetical protein
MYLVPSLRKLVPLVPANARLMWCAASVPAQPTTNSPIADPGSSVPVPAIDGLASVVSPQVVTLLRMIWPPTATGTFTRLSRLGTGPGR